jgi:hypothetical protein
MDVEGLRREWMPDRKMAIALSPREWTRDFRLIDETTSSEQSNAYHTAYFTITGGKWHFW